MTAADQVKRVVTPGIAGGSFIAGIVGALLAVPGTAFLNSAVRVLGAPDRGQGAQEDQDDALIEADADSVAAGQPIDEQPTDGGLAEDVSGVFARDPSRLIPQP